MSRVYLSLLVVMWCPVSRVYLSMCIYDVSINVSCDVGGGLKYFLLFFYCDLSLIY